MSKAPLQIVVSGAAGQIAYSLLPLIANGLVFGPDHPVQLRLLDIPPAQEALEGVKMELQDSAFTLLQEVVATSDLETAFKDAHVAVLVGGFPRKQGMERKDLIEKNVTIFKAQGEALEQYAKRDVKVLVVANPANTNCLIAMTYAPSIPRANFTAMTRLDHERLRGFLVEKVNAENKTNRISPKHVRRCIIWGNHSSTQVPDYSQVEVLTDDAKGPQPLSAFVTDSQWLQSHLVPDVRQRGAAIIKARKLSSAMSAASAIGAHLRDWLGPKGTPDGEFISMGVCSDGNPYDGVPEDLVYSFPIKCLGNGRLEIVRDVPREQSVEDMMRESAKELEEEKKEAMEIIGRI